jgi:WD40 repeat protein
MPAYGFYLHELPTLKPLWELDSTQRYRAIFTKEGDRIIVAANRDPAVQIRDCATGKVRQTIIAGVAGTNNALALSKDGRHLLIQHTDDANAHGIWHRLLAWTSINLDRFEPAHRDVTIVYDVDANRERLRLRGWNVYDALLSEDGATLVTTHDEGGGRVMRCWDVGATKPWRWPLAVPPLVGAALWGMAKGVARWRQRRADASGQVKPGTSA